MAEPPALMHATQVARPFHTPGWVYEEKSLSRGIPFVRVDGYDLGDRIVFGECTLYPNAGIVPFEPEAFDLELGSWLTVRRIGAPGARTGEAPQAMRPGGAIC